MLGNGDSCRNASLPIAGSSRTYCTTLYMFFPNFLAFIRWRYEATTSLFIMTRPRQPLLAITNMLPSPSEVGRHGCGAIGAVP